jgi:hypothetical protein
MFSVALWRWAACETVGAALTEREKAAAARKALDTTFIAIAVSEEG